ncbi:hypothetical protein MJT46_002193 [Ovis ammon polii x Ovis aries]|nr:hypothetical protein MJT46_002193 [Ovis ammon polii x Ovis aries]
MDEPLGTALLSVAAFPLEDFYIGTHHLINNVPKKEQTRLFHIALLAVCLGTGGIRAIVCPLGAYRLQEYGSQKRSSLNWFYWIMNLNAIVVFLGISYIQYSGAWALVLLIPFMSTLMALITLYMMHYNLIYQPEKFTGNLSAALSVLVAGFFEIHRKHFPPVEQPLSGKVVTVSSMPWSHLVLQYVLLGVAETLVNPAFVKDGEDEVFPKNHLLCSISVHDRDLKDTVDQSRLLNTHCGLGSTVIKPEGYNLSPQEIVKYVMDYREGTSSEDYDNRNEEHNSLRSLSFDVNRTPGYLVVTNVGLATDVMYID